MFFFEREHLNEQNKTPVVFLNNIAQRIPIKLDTIGSLSIYV